MTCQMIITGRFSKIEDVLNKHAIWRENVAYSILFGSDKQTDPTPEGKVPRFTLEQTRGSAAFWGLQPPFTHILGRWPLGVLSSGLGSTSGC